VTRKVAGTRVATARELPDGSPRPPRERLLLALLATTPRPSGGPSLVTLELVNEPAASLGEIIRQQRELTQLSMRQFAAMAGISNPYLSQIERGLREPSDRVVEAIARSLETSAEALYEQAGLIAEPDDEDVAAVPTAIQTDPALTPRERRVLLDIYDAFIAAAPAPRPRKRRPRREDAAGEP
jgi:transcriptional regulator with XRE-family HTH domain